MNLRTIRPLIALLAAGALALGAGVAAAAPAAADTPPCKDVLYMSLLGSGQHLGVDNGTPEMDTVRGGFRSEVNLASPELTVEYYALDYPAEPTDTLVQGVLAGPAGAAFALTVFTNSIDSATNLLSLKLDAAQEVCPQQAIVLAGFSQGSMVIQQYLGSTLPAQTILDRIVGVGLVASGDRRGKWHAEELGTAKNKGDGVRAVLQPAKAANLPAGFNKRVLSLCNKGDLVCDYTHASAIAGGKAHGEQYQTSAESLLLGKRLAGLAKAVAYPDSGTWTVVNKTPVSFGLSARTYTSAPAEWRPGERKMPRKDIKALPAGTVINSMPPGLNLNRTTGAIEGTPTLVGTYAFNVEARAATPNVWIPATITITVTKPVTGPPVPALPAGATLVKFTGTVESIDSQGNLLPAGVQVGSPIAGWYIYRADTPNTYWRNSPEIAYYRYYEQPYGAALQLGGTTISTFHPDTTGGMGFEGFAIDVEPNVFGAGSRFWWGVQYPLSSDGASIGRMYWDSFDDGNALTSNALPAGPLNLAAFDVNRITIESNCVTDTGDFCPIPGGDRMTPEAAAALAETQNYYIATINVTSTS